MNRRQESTHDRAQIAFSLYYQMGPERSLRRLHRQLRALGVRTSLATLKRHSVRFNWQGQIADLDAEGEERQRQRHIEDFLAMYERHAQLARAMQGAGGSAHVAVQHRKFSPMDRLMAPR